MIAVAIAVVIMMPAAMIAAVMVVNDTAADAQSEKCKPKSDKKT
jgi:hypothetical protein